MNRFSESTRLLFISDIIIRCIFILSLLACVSKIQKSFELVFILSICSIFANASYLIQHENVSGSIKCEFTHMMDKTLY